MRLLADQDVYQMTAHWLRTEGHDVWLAQELGMQRAPDEEILRKAKGAGRLLLTRDKGFGALVFLHGTETSGVILLRGTPLQIEEIHRELRRLFIEHAEEELKTMFCTVEPHRHRMRHLTRK